MADGARPLVLTDIPGQPGGFWGEHTTQVAAPRVSTVANRFFGKGAADRITGLAVGILLFVRQHRARALVTDGATASGVLATLQTLFPWRRRPHVMIAQLYVPASRWAYRAKRVQLTVIDRSVRRYVVWASHEIDDYHEAFGLPRDKMRCVPFHTTLDGYAYRVRDDGYIFAGGNYDRDYRTLVDAVRTINVPVWIATTRPEQLDGVTLPAHVRVAGTTHEGFRDAMAGATAVVVPMRKGLLHSGGQQTLLNALAMGKPAIAVGARWAADYVTPGEHALVVDYESVGELREAIRWVIDHREDASRMAARGRERAAAFTTRRSMEAVYRIALGEEPS
jgi:glycosyltransferase involved in cell wall biosynthesis